MNRNDVSPLKWRTIKQFLSCIRWEAWYWFRGRILRKPVTVKEVMDALSELRAEVINRSRRDSEVVQ